METVLLSSTPALAFECAKAYLPLDFVICSSKDSLTANESLEKAWAQTRSRVNETQKQLLLEEQRRWLKSVPLNCSVPEGLSKKSHITSDMQQCVTGFLNSRVGYLENYALDAK